MRILDQGQVCERATWTHNGVQPVGLWVVVGAQESVEPEAEGAGLKVMSET
jgi:hypothetical protein